MAVIRDRPYAGSNFLVDLGFGDPRVAASGFSEVVFPGFDVVAQQVSETHEPAHLILSRGFAGSSDLSAWWAEAQRGKSSPRVATIQLLDDDGSHVVMTWRFRNVRPVRLSYSALRATEATVLMETIALAFDSVEMR